MSTLIRNAHLISPDVDEKNVAIFVKGKSISKIFKDGEELPPADQTYDAAGRMVVPGFIDAHIHAGMGYESTSASPEAIPTIAEAKLKEGVTSWCPTTLTLAQETLAETMGLVEKYRRNPAFSKVLGVHLEGPYINPECLGAQNPAFVRKPSFDEVKALNEISPVRIVTFAPDVEGSAEFTRQLMDAGIIPSAGHTNATYAQFQACQKEGLGRLTHFCNQMTKLHHREIGLVGAGLMDDRVYCEMICDKIHLCPDMIRLAFKIKPIEKILLITDAMEATGLPDGDYQLGGLAVVVKDGAARLKGNNALAGSTLQYNVGLKNIREVTGLPLKECIKTTSWNQANDLGLANLGKIEPGYLADLAVLDDDFSVKAVFVEGELRLNR
ncbi:MAG: N-acetylglucosamine-6-phosphate deacetylase [Victivallales bacterium]|nr:N-acetylglucosamine-6-phosphate deacetylase [Victivallales bacterium]